MTMHRLPAVLALVLALGAALGLTACGSSSTPSRPAAAHTPVASATAPAWPSASTTEYKDDHQICKLFTALAALATALGKKTLTPQSRGMITAIVEKYQKPLTSQLRHDATATLSNPTGPAIVRLQADCTQLGVYKAVWPG